MQYSTVMAPTLSTNHIGHKILQICGLLTGWYMLNIKNIFFSLPFNDLTETEFICSFILSKINLNCSVVLAGLSHCDLRLLLTFCYQLLQCITAWPCHTIFLSICIGQKSARQSSTSYVLAYTDLHGFAPTNLQETDHPFVSVVIDCAQLL